MNTFASGGSLLFDNHECDALRELNTGVDIYDIGAVAMVVRWPECKVWEIQIPQQYVQVTTGIPGQDFRDVIYTHRQESLSIRIMGIIHCPWCGEKLP
jgi:hypothetical protein